MPKTEWFGTNRSELTSFGLKLSEQDGSSAGKRYCFSLITFAPGKAVSQEQGLCDESFIVFVVSSLLLNISGRRLRDSGVLRPCFSLSCSNVKELL